MSTASGDSTTTLPNDSTLSSVKKADSEMKLSNYDVSKGAVSPNLLPDFQNSKHIKELNDFITCHLCKGYLIDATTIVECLHSFCKTCILKYLDENNPKSRFCPKCDVQIHKTKPKLNIRSDPTLQDIVYKIVPGLFKSEMGRRKEFYFRYPDKALGLSNEEKGEINGERLILSTDDLLQVTIEYFPEVTNPYKLLPFNNDENKNLKLPNSINQRRYLLCKAGMRVFHLKKFIRFKYDLEDKTQVDFFYKHELLKNDYTIMDLAYIYSWRRHVPIPLYYLIIEPDKSKEDYLWLFSQSKLNSILPTKTPAKKPRLKTPIKTNNSNLNKNKKRPLVSTAPSSSNSSPSKSLIVPAETIKSENSNTIQQLKEDKILSKKLKVETTNLEFKPQNVPNINITEDDSSTDISESSFQIDLDAKTDSGNENSDVKDSIDTKTPTNTEESGVSKSSNISCEKNMSSECQDSPNIKVNELFVNLLQRVEQMQPNDKNILDESKKSKNTESSSEDIIKPIDKNLHDKKDIDTNNSTMLKNAESDDKQILKDNNSQNGIVPNVVSSMNTDISQCLETIENRDVSNQYLNPLNPDISCLNIKTAESTSEASISVPLSKSVNADSTVNSSMTSETNIQNSLLGSLLFANLANTNDFKKLLYSQSINSNSQNLNLDVKLNHSIKPLNLK